MSDFETDPAQQSVTKIGRSAALAASLLAERITRIRSDLAVAERTRQQERATQLRRTYEAQRDAARAELRTADTQWLRTATTSELAHAWRAAEVWSRVEPDVFTPDRDRIGQAITRRVGVDVARLPVDEATKRLDGTGGPRVRGGCRTPSRRAARRGPRHGTGGRRPHRGRRPGPRHRTRTGGRGRRGGATWRRDRSHWPRRAMARTIGPAGRAVGVDP